MSERAHPVKVADLKNFSVDQYPGPILASQILILEVPSKPLLQY